MFVSCVFAVCVRFFVVVFGRLILCGYLCLCGFGLVFVFEGSFEGLIWIVVLSLGGFFVYWVFVLVFLCLCRLFVGWEVGFGWVFGCLGGCLVFCVWVGGCLGGGVILCVWVEVCV